MTRTTIDLDPVILEELKQRQRREGKTLGRLVSELLARALRLDAPPRSDPVSWKTRDMRAGVDLDDKKAVRRALEGR